MRIIRNFTYNKNALTVSSWPPKIVRGGGGAGMNVEGKGVMVPIFYGMLPQFNIIMI